MTTVETRAGLSDDQLVEFLSTIEGADSVELKLTVVGAEQRSAVAALEMDPLEAQIRQVYFFDTPDLALNQQGVVVRARRVQKKGDDTVVKLRPVVPENLSPDVRTSPGFGVEVDAMPGGLRLLGLHEACAGEGRGQRDGAGGTAAPKALLEGAACVLRRARA